jgi:hypothetical protein
MNCYCEGSKGHFTINDDSSLPVDLATVTNNKVFALIDVDAISSDRCLLLQFAVDRRLGLLVA